MPPSIDPVTNLFSSGGSVVKRFFILFFSGWVGLFVGFFSVSFQEFDDLLHPIDTLDMALPYSVWEAVGLLTLWPIIYFWICLGDVPLYIPIYIATILTAYIKVILLDEPPIVWCVFVSLTLSTGIFINSASLWSIIPFGVGVYALGALFWYFVKLDYPHWIDKARELVSGERD